MTWSLVTVMLLAQPLATSRFEDGAIVGRICVTGAEGACEAAVSGLGGIVVRDETGLAVTTDDAGRFHLAQVQGRAFQVDQGGRLAPVVHRLKVDPDSLPGTFRVMEGARSVEVPAGGAAWVEFRVARVPAQALLGVVAGAAPLSISNGVPSWTLRLHAEPGARLRRGDAEVQARDGLLQLPLRLASGPNAIPLTLVASTSRLEFLIQHVVAAKAGPGWMVVPGRLERVGQVAVTGTSPSTVRVEVPPGSRATLDGLEVPLDARGGGRASLDRPGAEFVLEGRDGLRWGARVEPAARGVEGQGLASLELAVSPSTGALSLSGRGAASARGRWGPVSASLDVDVRDEDVPLARTSGLASALSPRRFDQFARPPEPGVQPQTWADDSLTRASNPAAAPLRAELRWAGVGSAGFGGYRALSLEGELGRFARASQAAYAEVGTPEDASVGGRLRAWAAPVAVDARSAMSSVPLHERFTATGGSFFLLRQFPVVEGSELVRVELRDALTGLPLSERHLVRGQDYTLEASTGRLVLSAPLAMSVQPSASAADPLSSGATQVLVVDAQALASGSVGAAAWGARVGGWAGPVRASLDAVREGPWSLQAGLLTAAVGPARLSAEVARSAGALTGLVRSDDGGWTSRAALATDSQGSAVTLRARSTALFGKGRVDLSFRFREPGFQDAAGASGSLLVSACDPGLVDLQGARALRQYSLRAEQPVGPVSLGVMADQRVGAEQRLLAEPFRAQATVGAAWVGYGGEGWSARVEARAASFEVAAVDGPWTRRDSVSLGVAGSWRILPWLGLRAAHRQRIAGAVVERLARPAELSLPSADPTFTQAGVDVGQGTGPTLGLRVGWGPVLGPQAWGQASWSRGEETWYGAHALDVDSPWAGPRRTAVGVRRDLGEGASVFVEDLGAHDATTWRAARAVGATQRLTNGLTVTGRWEHALGFTPDVAGAGGDAASARVAWEAGPHRAWVHGEARDVSGQRQWGGTAGGEWRVSEAVRASGRVLLSRSERGGVMEGRIVDGAATLAWRFEGGFVAARYSVLVDRRPSQPVERQVQTWSLLPAVRLGSRVELASGFHVAVAPSGVVVAASARPAVRLVGGLDVAVEGAWRSASLKAVTGVEDSSLVALRPELGWRLDERFRLAAGYSLFGFCGTGLADGACANADKVFVRGEAAW